MGNKTLGDGLGHRSGAMPGCRWRWGVLYDGSRWVGSQQVDCPRMDDASRPSRFACRRCWKVMEGLATEVMERLAIKVMERLAIGLMERLAIEAM